MKYSIRAGGAAVTVALALALAGCGGNTSSNTNASSASASDVAAALPKAKAELSSVRTIDQAAFPELPAAIDPGQHTAAVISCAQVGVTCAQMSGFVQDALSSVGWTTKPTYDGKFDPRVQAGYVQQAVNQGVDAIFLVSIDASSIKSAVESANAKNIPVVCMACINPTMKGKVIDVAADAAAVGRAWAAYATVQLKGKGKLVTFQDKSFPYVAARIDEFAKVLPEYCPGCTVEQQQFPPSDLAESGPPTWTGFLSANPAGTVDAVVAPYDAMALPAVKSAKQAGRDDLFMMSVDAYPEFVQAIASGDYPAAAATVASPNTFLAYASVDLAARAIQGKALWDPNTVPVVLIDKDNAADYPDGIVQTPFDTKAAFQKIWGKA